MGLNKVATEIRQNAEKEAQRVVGEGKSEGQKILDEARKRVKEQEAAMRKEIEAELRQIDVKIQTLMKKQTREFEMNAKKELVEKVYQEFLDHLRNMKGGERERIFKQMARQTKDQINNPKTVYARKEDASLAKKLFRGMHVITKDMDGGFVLESGDGKEAMDFRFETFIELLKGRTLKSVSKTLFGG